MGEVIVLVISKFENYSVGIPQNKNQSQRLL